MSCGHVPSGIFEQHVCALSQGTGWQPPPSSFLSRLTPPLTHWVDALGSAHWATSAHPLTEPPSIQMPVLERNFGDSGVPSIPPLMPAPVAST